MILPKRKTHRALNMVGMSLIQSFWEGADPVILWPGDKMDSLAGDVDFEDRTISAIDCRNALPKALALMAEQSKKPYRAYTKAIKLPRWEWPQVEINPAYSMRRPLSQRQIMALENLRNPRPPRPPVLQPEPRVFVARAFAVSRYVPTLIRPDPPRDKYDWVRSLNKEEAELVYGQMLALRNPPQSALFA